MSFIIDNDPADSLPFCPVCGYQMVSPEPDQYLCLGCGSSDHPEFISVSDILNGTYNSIRQYEQQLQALGASANLITDFKKALLQNAANRAVAWCDSHHCAHSKGEDDIAHAIMDTGAT